MDISTVTTFLNTRLSSLFELFVMRLLSTCLSILQLAVLLLESFGLLLASQDLLNEGLLPLALLDAAREELGRTLDNGANLAVLGRLHLARLFLVMAMRIEDVAHLQELKVTLELGCEISARQIEPIRPSGGLLLLQPEVSYALIKVSIFAKCRVG